MSTVRSPKIARALELIDANMPLKTAARRVGLRPQTVQNAALELPSTGCVSRQMVVL